MYETPKKMPNKLADSYIYKEKMEKMKVRKCYRKVSSTMRRLLKFG